MEMSISKHRGRVACKVKRRSIDLRGIRSFESEVLVAAAQLSCTHRQ
jgi:hypothetical protein